MKDEWLNEQLFRTRNEARAVVVEYIEIFYNRQRLHESNSCLISEGYYVNAMAV